MARQTQKLSNTMQMSSKMMLSPQMQRNQTLLIASVQELQHEIFVEVEDNPALEIVEESVDSLDNVPKDKYKGKEKEQYSEFLESLLTTPETLSDHLIWQLRMEDISEQYFEIGRTIIENLDENGFLLEDPYVLCKQLLQATEHEVDELLVIIQEFDPVGCACKDVFESLHTQLLYLDIDESHRNQLNSCFSKIESLVVSGTKYNNDVVEKVLHEFLQDDEYNTYLKLLVPYPGRAYVRNHIDRDMYVVPDAVIKLLGDELVIKINQDIIPVLAINENMLVSKESEEAEEKKLATEWVASAESFINGLKYRGYALEKVVSFIAHFQREYFLDKQRYLKPFTRKELAVVLELNESTISRLTSNKYIQTDKGIFPLKYFFSQRSVNEETSGQQVKLEIKKIIERLQANNQKLSDRIIAEQLEKIEIYVARRTVSKYRKLLESE